MSGKLGMVYLSCQDIDNSFIKSILGVKLPFQTQNDNLEGVKSPILTYVIQCAIKSCNYLKMIIWAQKW